jgi:hypothetical protein
MEPARNAMRPPYHFSERAKFIAAVTWIAFLVVMIVRHIWRVLG